MPESGHLARYHRRVTSHSPADPGASDTSGPVDCPRCGRRIAEGSERITADGAHRHQVTNPDGYAYDLACFARAPGCIAVGEALREASWFPDYTWQRAFCRHCSTHVGWLFRHKTGAFYGLIETAHGQ